jgi:hypothetical protein
VDQGQTLSQQIIERRKKKLKQIHDPETQNTYYDARYCHVSVTIWMQTTIDACPFLLSGFGKSGVAHYSCVTISFVGDFFLLAPQYP